MVLEEWATSRAASTSCAARCWSRRSSDPDIAQAEALLDDFGRFRETEHDPAERRKLLGQPFDRIWQDGGTIVAVKPRAPFVR